jgi:MOSC domain-containing protein YiiM
MNIGGTGAKRMAISILSVQTGGIAPLGPERVPSGFVKSPRQGAVHAGRLGLEGDAQADLSVHGGPEKAVYAYAASHYPGWALLFPALAAAFHGGAMGENLTVAQMDEAAICVGDIHGIGTARLQVCQPRQPCYKFSLRHHNNQLPKAMVRSGHSGWYYRVLEEGEIRAGDGLVLLERPNPDFAFTRLVEIVYRGGATPKELARMVEMPGLASQWRDTAKSLLE